MRISDWSSDVCSSDLDAPYAGYVQVGRRRDGDGEINVTNGGQLRISAGESVNTNTYEPGLQIARDSGSLGRVTVDGNGSQIHMRSEEHTSELQSLMRISYAVFCLKKNKKMTSLQ